MNRSQAFQRCYREARGLTGILWRAGIGWWRYGIWFADGHDLRGQSYGLVAPYEDRTRKDRACQLCPREVAVRDVAHRKIATL